MAFDPKAGEQYGADTNQCGGQGMTGMIDAFASVEAMSEALASRAVSSVELTTIQLDRIARLDGELHAFAEVDRERTMQRAAIADARLARGETGSLLGVPLAIKDIFDHAGSRTRAGSLVLDERLPDRSANVVERLEAAGMVVLGRTHMVEFAYGGWGTNAVRGTPRNPWDRDLHRVPGGSSSGSAVAVAAGLAPAALGTDTGGSIRTPATWNGVVGLKTSVGLVGRGGVVPLAPTHDSVGPMTRTVRDAALMLAAMIGEDQRDAATIGAPEIDPLGQLEAGISGLRLGVLPDRDLDGTDSAVRRLYDVALADLVAIGAELAEVALPLSIAGYLASGGDIMSVESYALVGRYVERAPEKVDPVILARILRGKEISEPVYHNLLQTRLAAQASFAAAAAPVDAIVMPGSHLLPIPLAEVDEAVPPNRFGRLVNYLDLASLAVPIGLSPDGLPAGLQIAVRKFADPLALRIGRALERHRGGLFQPPPGY